MKTPFFRKLITMADRPPFRPLLAALYNIAAAKSTGGKLSVFYDQGYWFFQCNGMRFAGSDRFDFHRWHIDNLPQRVELLEKDHAGWCHLYHPKPGDIIVDAGAEIGSDTLLFARAVGASGRVIAIEAHPRTFSRLVATLRANRLTNATAIHAAIADKGGELRITTDEGMESNFLTEDGEGSLVRADTLDNLLREFQFPRIDLLKMNIEGAEQLAIRGMDETIARTKHVVIACHDFLATQKDKDWFRTREAVRSYLEGHHFEVVQRTDVPAYAADHLHGRRRE